MNNRVVTACKTAVNHDAVVGMPAYRYFRNKRDFFIIEHQIRNSIRCRYLFDMLPHFACRNNCFIHALSIQQYTSARNNRTRIKSCAKTYNAL